MREFVERLRRILRSPQVGFATLLVGLVVAAVVAPRRHDELVIAQGGELVLLALAGFLARGHLVWFFRGLVVAGAAVPLAGGLSSTIFYHGPLRADHFLELLLISLLPGLGVLVLGWRGLRSVKLKPAPEGEAEPSSAVRAADKACELSVWLLVASLLTGTWNDLTVLGVLVGALVLLGAAGVLLVETTDLGSAGLGKVLVSLGLLTALTGVLVAATQGRRCQEAVLAVPPGLLLVLVGAVLWLGDRAR